MKVAAVIVAAGAGIRAGGEKPKQYQYVGDKTVLRWTLEAFTSHPLVSQVITVIGQGHQSEYQAAKRGMSVVEAVEGGATRQESCRIGIEACAPSAPDFVLIHDGARPFVSHEMIDRVIDALHINAAVIPVMPVSDTIKFTQNGIVQQTLDRASLFSAQTPQGFHFEKIRAAHTAAAATKNAGLTDDASVAEAYGMKVCVVAGEPANRKLTTMQDITIANLEWSARQLSERPDVRVGQGLDFHVFAAGKSVWLCGVEIPHHKKLKGHSDADVALHALTDAILGAIGEGDIGTHFPPTDPQWKGAPSAIFLSKAYSLLRALNGQLANVDITILAEEPKISPHLSAMKTALANQLQLDPKRIAIKATTTEKMGAIGRKEGMAAHAVVTVRLPL